MPQADDRAAIEAQIPEGHRAFVDSLYTKYGIPKPTKPGMRSRFVRSKDMAELQLEAVLESDVDLVACGIGAPESVVRMLQERGKRVAALVGSPRHAVRALRTGVDMLVAQGYDAGAHTGVVGTFSLIPQIVDVAGNVPVLAAGGVATGRHIAAALALGAKGVWMGTRWLTTTEYASEIPAAVQQKLLEAGSEDTVISRADSGKTLRQIRSAWSDEWAAPGAPKPLPMPLQDILVGDLLGAIDEHNIEPLMHYPAGQSVAYCKTVQSVAEVMAELVEEADASAPESLRRASNGSLCVRRVTSPTLTAMRLHNRIGTP